MGQSTQDTTKPAEIRNVVQRLALLITTGAMPSTPTITLNRLANIPHIIDYLEGEAAMGALRLKAYGDWTTDTLQGLTGTIIPHTNINNAYIAILTS